MPKKKQHIAINGPLSWGAIKVYLNGELTEKDMYSLERKIQNEPFEKEAFDGFNDHAPASMEKDLEELREKIRRKTGNTLRSKPALIYNWRMIAALAALIIIIPLTVIIIIRSGDTNGMELTENGKTTNLKKDTQIAHNKSIVEFKEDAETESSQVVDEAIKIASNDLQKEEIVSDPLSKRQVRTRPKNIEIVEEVSMRDNAYQHLQGLENVESKKTTGLSEQPLKDSSKKILLIETETDTENILSANQSSMATTILGKSAPTPPRDTLDRKPPLPPEGLAAYKEYLKAELMKIDANIKGEFIVKANITDNGQFADIDLVKGISKRIDRKFIKILENSPKWIPATKKGKNISDTATFSLSLN